MQQTFYHLLSTLREHALAQNAAVSLFLHNEDSHFVRYANNAVSLNTSENLLRLSVSAYQGNKVAQSDIIADLADVESMKRTVDTAIAMLSHASPLSYTPMFPVIQKDSTFTEGFDAALATLSNEEILAFVDNSTKGLPTDDIMLSGNFSVGATATMSMSTATTHYVYWRTTDAQITLVLASLKDKWEINAEQSATKKSDLDSQKLFEHLAFLKIAYTTCPAQKIPTGDYQVVFGPAATAEYLGFLTHLGLSGNLLMRGYALHQQDDVGKQVLSPLVTITEKPDDIHAFGRPTDFYGRSREARACYKDGVFNGFLWDQSAADEYQQQPSAVDVSHLSYCLAGGQSPLDSLPALANSERDTDILYVPYLHYTGLVNPSEGLVTGTTRFGALLLKKDGNIALPYNVRFTQRVGDIFGKKLTWLSKNTTYYNTSNTYDARNPEAIGVPCLMACQQVEVELSNDSF